MNKVIVITCEADKVNAILDALEEATYDEDGDRLGTFDVQVKDEPGRLWKEALKRSGVIFDEKGDTNERDKS